LLIAAADPEKDGERDDGDTGYTSNDATDDGTDDGRRDRAPSKTDLIVLSTVGVCDLNDARDNL
jgi:hypothetical protein